jgi:hypothetical protein
MKTFKLIAIIILGTLSHVASGQIPYPLTQMPNPFPTDYMLDKRYSSQKTEEYKDIDGSPYLKSEFTDGVFCIKDTVAFKLPIRYNIYKDEMEYQLKGLNYVVGSPQSLKKVLLDGAEFAYLPFIQKGGYFELFKSGKCTLAIKRTVEFKPSEGSKPIIGLQPAKFVKKPDIFYFVIDHSQAFKIENLKSVLDALQDQKQKIEDFIRQEKIKNTKKENLAKIVDYYNTLQN